MFLKHLKNCQEFIAGDGSTLRELLHPEKTDLQIRYSLAYAKVMAGQVTKTNLSPHIPPIPQAVFPTCH